MIKAIIFDCFGVLYLDPSIGFYQREITNFDQLRTSILDIDKQYDYGFIDETEHARLIADISGLDYDFVRHNVRGEHARNQELIDDSQNLRRTYKLGMLSNIGKGGIEPFFSASQRTELFDAVVLSSDVGVIKPSREIFLIMAEKLGVEPYECIMIDDRKDNVEGARAADMQGILYQTNQQCMRDVARLLEAENA